MSALSGEDFTEQSSDKDIVKGVADFSTSKSSMYNQRPWRTLPAAYTHVCVCMNARKIQYEE